MIRYGPECEVLIMRLGSDRNVTDRSLRDVVRDGFISDVRVCFSEADHCLKCSFRRVAGIGFAAKFSQKRLLRTKRSI
jgi:hypothetical protein